MTIKEKLQQLVNHTITYKIILILLVISVCALLFPMLLIAKYNVPSDDDFSYGAVMRSAIQEHKGFSDIMRLLKDQIQLAYNTWQGLISSTILWTFQPDIFGEQFYIIVPYIMLFSLSAGIFLFINSFFNYFKGKMLSNLIISLTVFIISTQFLPAPVEGFYWYAGSVCYTFFFGLSLVLYALIIKIAANKTSHKKILIKVLASVLCIVIAFSNFVTALTTGIILISLILLLIVLHNKNYKQLLIPSILFGISFYFAIAAPGNSVRQMNFEVRPGFFGAIWLSLQYAITQLYSWNSIPIVALYIFLLPFLWKTASETTFSFKFPWLVSLYSFGLQSVMNCPTYYAYMDRGPGRVEDIRFYAMVILIVINLFYWEGWLIRKFSIKYNEKVSGLKISYLFGVCLMFLGGLVLSEKDQSITSISAFQSYRSGEAGLYKHVHKQRLEILNDPEIKDALLREFPKKPYVIYFDDITYDPEDWRNLSMSQYYHKDSVRLMTHEEFEASLENK